MSEREIRWEQGYDHVGTQVGGGRHGMNIRWLLHGEHGTVQFLIYSGWLPTWVENPEDSWGPRVRPDRPLPMPNGGSRPSLMGPMAADLGYHWRTPLWQDSDSGRDNCDALRGGGRCWYDGSGLNAEPVFAKLLTEGGEAVWAEMSAYYDRLVSEMQAATG